MSSLSLADGAGANSKLQPEVRSVNFPRVRGRACLPLALQHSDGPGENSTKYKPGRPREDCRAIGLFLMRWDEQNSG